MARLVLAALCAACAPAWAQPSDTPPGADLTVVQTAQGLRDAVASGAQHIEIQQHLGFLQATADDPGDEGPTLAVLPGTRSIRGNCTDPLPLSVQASRAVQRGQCMIVVRQSFLHPTATQGHTLWLHNLYVVASGGLASNSSAMLEWAGARTLEAGAPASSKTDPGVNRLWITSSVLEGDRVSTSATVIDDAAYLADVLISNHTAPWPGLTLLRGASVALDNVTFADLASRTVEAAALIVAPASVTALQAVAFRNPKLQHDISAAPGTVFAQQRQDEAPYSVAGAGEVQAISELPAQPRLLSADDADFVAIRKAALAGRQQLPLRAPAPAAPGADSAPMPPTAESAPARARERSTPVPSRTHASDRSTELLPLVTTAATAVILAILVASILLLARFATQRHGDDEHERHEGLSGLRRLGAHMASDGSEKPSSSERSRSASKEEVSMAYSAAFQRQEAPGDFALTLPPSPLSPSIPRAAAPVRPRNFATALRESANWLPAPAAADSAPRTLYARPPRAVDDAAIRDMLRTRRDLGEASAAEGRVVATQEQGSRLRLEDALQTLVATWLPEVFAGCFIATQARWQGSRSMVQYARGGEGAIFHFAIKFYRHARDYESDEAVCSSAATAAIAPDVYAGSANADGAARSRSGYAFPPFLVMERGMTLAEWAARRRTLLETLAMCRDCATLLATLHAAGRVHRDLKPDHVLLTLQTQRWRIIDFSRAGLKGQRDHPQCTLGYAAPEVVAAWAARHPIAAAPTQDVWALGAMAFEALTRVAAVDPAGGDDGCVALARGSAQYPWERHDFLHYLGGARAAPAVRACLERAPGGRPRAGELARILGDACEALRLQQ